MDRLAVVTGLRALKWACRGNSDLGWITPLLWVTEKSSPRLSRPVSFHATGNSVGFLRMIVFVSFLMTHQQKNMLKRVCLLVH